MSSEIKWQALEYEHEPKSADWFWAVWILAIGGAVATYLFDNFLFGILILLGAFSLSLFASRKPSLINFTLSEKGIFINKKLILYSSLKSFWVEENKKILFLPKKKTVPYIIIPLNQNLANEKQIREYLLRHLAEVEHGETLSQKIMDKFIF